MNTNLVWKITKHVLYIVDFIFYNKEKLSLSFAFSSKVPRSVNLNDVFLRLTIKTKQNRFQCLNLNL